MHNSNPILETTTGDCYVDTLSLLSPATMWFYVCLSTYLSIYLHMCTSVYVCTLTHTHAHNAWTFPAILHGVLWTPNFTCRHTYTYRHTINVRLMVNSIFFLVGEHWTLSERTSTTVSSSTISHVSSRVPFVTTNLVLMPFISSHA